CSLRSERRSWRGSIPPTASPGHRCPKRYGASEMRGLVALLVLVGLLGGGIVLLMRDDGGQPDARVLVAEALAGDADARYARAIAPRIFNFPHDHRPHPEFPNAWWYYTRHRETAGGRHFA